MPLFSLEAALVVVVVVVVVVVATEQITHVKSLHVNTLIYNITNAVVTPPGIKVLQVYERRCNVIHNNNGCGGGSVLLS